MEPKLIYVILVFVYGVSWRQSVCTLQASALHARAGDNVTLHCLLLNNTNASITTAAPLDPAMHGPGPYTISWYKKPAGQGPQLLLSIRLSNHSVTYGAGVSPDKVSAAFETSLRLHGFQRSDSAVYYCGISHGGKGEKWRGEGQA